MGVAPVFRPRKEGKGKRKPEKRYWRVLTNCSDSSGPCIFSEKEKEEKKFTRKRGSGNNLSDPFPGARKGRRRYRKGKRG